MKYGDGGVSDDDDVERGFKEFDQKRAELFAKWNIGKTPSSIPSHTTPNPQNPKDQIFNFSKENDKEDYNKALEVYKFFKERILSFEP